MPSFRVSTAATIGLCAIGLALGLAAYAAQASAEPVTSTEYAEYKNDRWHFSLAVPDDMTVEVYDQPGDAQTMQFLDGTGEYKFQVSAWPYSQLDLTLGRIGQPSGISDQPDHLEIVDVVRDDLFTVFFQKNSVHYVVNTIPELEPWLTDILTTWQFTD